MTFVRLALLMVLFAACSLTDGVAWAQAVIPRGELAAELKPADGRVFRIEVETVDKQAHGGTTFLLARDGQFGFFSTCYHVMHGATAFTIRDRAGFDDPVASSREGAKVYRMWNRDIALLKVRLRADPKGELKPIFPGADWDNPDQLAALALPDPKAPEANPMDRGPQIRAVAFGYPSAIEKNFIAAEEVLQGERDMELLDLFRLNAKSDAPRDGGADVQLSEGRARILTRELTFPGMSGSLVVEAERGRFAGMLFGRGADRLGLVGLMVPGRDIIAGLREAEKGGRWREFKPEVFAAPTPFRAEVPQNSAPPRWLNDLDWTSLDRWIAVFEDSPSMFLEQFLEVDVKVNELRLKARQANRPDQGPIRIVLSDPGGDSRRNEDRPRPVPGTTTITLNGETSTLKPTEVTPLKLVGGENLLVLNHAVDGPRGLIFNQVFRPATLSVDLLVGDFVAMTIRRTLPAAVHGFAIFVTIDQDGPTARPVIARSAPNGRLAVRLSELGGIISLVPMEMEIDKDDRRGTRAKGLVSFTGPDAVRLAYRSDQTLSLALNTTIKVDEARANIAGIKITARNKSLRGTLHGRLQFPNDIDDSTYLSARALGFDSPDSIVVRFPLRIEAEGREKNGPAAPLPADQLKQPDDAIKPPEDDGIGVDLGGALRLALNCYLNNELLRPADASNPPLARTRDFLEKVAIVSKVEGWTLEPRQMLMRRAADDSEWLIVTFSLTGNRENPPRPLGSNDLLPLPERIAKTGLELLVKDVPAAVAKRYVRDAPGAETNPLLGQKLDKDGKGPIAEEVRLSVSTGDFAGSPELTKPIRFPDESNDLAKALRATIDATLARRAIDLHASVNPKMVALALRGFLPEEYLAKLAVEGEGRLRLSAKRDVKGATIALDIGEMPFTLKGTGTLTIPGKADIDNPSLTLDRVHLEGKIEAREVSGEVAGRINCEQARFEGRTLSKVDSRFKAAIAWPKNRALDANIFQPEGNYVSVGGLARLSFSFSIWVDSQGKLGTDFGSKLLGF